MQVLYRLFVRQMCADDEWIRNLIAVWSFNKNCRVAINLLPLTIRAHS